MFGREPQLPVDFLLGADKEAPCGETPEEWVQKHQHSLKGVHEHVRQQLEAKAERRNQEHNQKVTDPGLEEGQLVYLRNHQVRGRNKIQDLWHHHIYRVVNQPQGQGAVYTIIPVDQDGPVRRVHRTELRSVPKGEGNTLPVIPSNVKDPMSVVVTESDSEEEFLTLILADEERDPVVHHNSPHNPGNPVQDQNSGSERSPGSPRPASPLAPSLRRSTRRTAGVHSNPHRLPYGAGS